jgi:predicted glutamine amidotransferase
MFGMVASRAVSARELLRDAPRAMRALSHEHADGWGLAVHSHDGWLVHKSTSCAARCTRYDELAACVESRLVIAHVRKKTVGETSLVNTHPFQRDGVVFAHNGTVTAVNALVARSSREQLAAMQGDTDSERLFAFVMTFVESHGIERGVAAAVRALQSLGDIGTASFLFSDGVRLYAHRLGRSLFTLAREGVWIVASEQLTDEPWVEVPERALIVLEAEHAPSRLAA